MSNLYRSEGFAGNFTLAELREVTHGDELLPTPTDSTWTYWVPRWYYAYLDVHLLETVGKKVMRERRDHCIELLTRYRNDEVSRFSEVSSREFSDVFEMMEENYISHEFH